MHNFLSGIVQLFLSPVNWIILLLITAIFLKNQRTRKIVIISSAVIFLLFSNVWLSSNFAKMWQQQPIEINSLPKSSCVIVLGGFGSPDQYGRGYFNSTCDRFIQTLKCYKAGKADKIIIAGGNGKKQKEDFREALWVKQQFVSVGVPDTAVIIEDQSMNTADNALNTKWITEKLGYQQPFILVTSATHMPRAQLIFKKAGVETVPLPSNYIAGRDVITWSSIIPEPDILNLWDVLIKEVVAYYIYKIK